MYINTETSHTTFCTDRLSVTERWLNLQESSVHTAVHAEVGGAPRADGVGPGVGVQTVDVCLLQGVQDAGGGTVLWDHYSRGKVGNVWGRI